MIRKLASGKYQVSLRTVVGKQKVVGVFDNRGEAEDQQRAVRLVEIQRMIAREGILSSVERVLRCSPNGSGPTAPTKTC